MKSHLCLMLWGFDSPASPDSRFYKVSHLRHPSNRNECDSKNRGKEKSGINSRLFPWELFRINKFGLITSDLAKTQKPERRRTPTKANNLIFLRDVCFHDFVMVDGSTLITYFVCFGMSGNENFPSLRFMFHKRSDRFSAARTYTMKGWREGRSIEMCHNSHVTCERFLAVN